MTDYSLSRRCKTNKPLTLADYQKRHRFGEPSRRVRVGLRGASLKGWPEPWPRRAPLVVRLLLTRSHLRRLRVWPAHPAPR